MSNSLPAWLAFDAKPMVTAAAAARHHREASLCWDPVFPSRQVPFPSHFPSRHRARRSSFLLNLFSRMQFLQGSCKSPSYWPLNRHPRLLLQRIRTTHCRTRIQPSPHDRSILLMRRITVPPLGQVPTRPQDNFQLPPSLYHTIPSALPATVSHKRKPQRKPPHPPTLSNNPAAQPLPLPLHHASSNPSLPARSPLTIPSLP